MSSLRKEDRADSGKLEKDFQKRVGAAEPSILSGNLSVFTHANSNPLRKLRL